MVISISYLGFILLAVLLNSAIQAVWTQGFADVPAMQQNPVVGLEPQLNGDVAGQITLDIVRCLALG